MPQEQKKEAPKSQKGLLSRIFGASELTPPVEEGISIARRENPNLAPVKPYGLWSRLTASNAQAYADEFGNSIYIDPNQTDPQEVANTLAHEQKHIDQFKDRGFLSKLWNRISPQESYNVRPNELEAYQVEKARRAKLGMFHPYYNSAMGGQYWPNDINLRAPKRKQNEAK